MKTFLLTLLIYFFLIPYIKSDEELELGPSKSVDCNTLSLGQYLCPDPSYFTDPKSEPLIDPKTQEISGCTPENKATIRCLAVDGLVCKETQNRTFTKEVDCRWTNGYSFETSLLLSIFLGMLGLDRFYLGYPAIGLAKFCTFGFMFLGQLIDIILIATQVVGPADGSAYVIPYYGARVHVIYSDNTTYKLRQDNW
ncbi:TM2 domain-containing protein CG10795 [Anthonomus grandis grandis]|uniref:TM2 domain-containing protein CG10795 n=1 Tax=Anthonomus grandis grandis TaxID=2921223 RepID=UPI00216620BA|nr:TM2 domain-containing protein CG10795 [Anthonomus grandis grandis]